VGKTQGSHSQKPTIILSGRCSFSKNKISKGTSKKEIRNTIKVAKIAIKNCRQLTLPKGPKSEKYDRLFIKLTTQNSDTCQNKNDENSKIIEIFKCS
jgi:hypothetical protein